MILIVEQLEQAALGWLQERSDCLYDPSLCEQRDKLEHYLHSATALIVRNKTKVTEDLIKQAHRLQVVGRLGVGLDNLDCSALAKQQVTTVYAPGANANAVAELCLSFMLAQSRQLLLADHSTRRGEWARQTLVGRELGGKTIGIIGLGAVGSRLAKLCLGLDCQVVTNTTGQTHGLPSLRLKDLLRVADFVSLNVPLTAKTRQLIGAEEIALLQPHAFIINTARGEVIDEHALYQALLEKRIAGAALDVRRHEPPGDGDPFLGLDNVILTPHLGGWTEEAQSAVCQMVVEDVWSVLQGKQPRFPVPNLNFVPVEPAMSIG